MEDNSYPNNSLIQATATALPSKEESSNRIHITLDDTELSLNFKSVKGRVIEGDNPKSLCEMTVALVDWVKKLRPLTRIQLI